MAFRLKVWSYTDRRIRHLVDLATKNHAAFTAFCAKGPGIQKNRIEGVRTIDIAPTVADYLKSQLQQMRGAVPY